MEEKVFFNKGNVMVTNSRFIVNGQTYAISNVTSVKASENSSSQASVFLLFILGFMCFFLDAGYVGVGVGILLWVIAFYDFKTIKHTYSVILNTSAGENKALSSQDEGYVKDIVKALNDAIVSRG
ncbi:DUF6232 family protein [Shewanella xiamenensis]|uniref:DUF6232 family protein n=1 Tax=Shewanella xiamenensis TaxID=332186 RepID=UPI0021BFEECE|nr:DUF6232 family protein [Shewanella xiamenensis]MCT8866313.1 DUF6232 family protein [Shewanella xiamenensis]